MKFLKSILFFIIGTASLIFTGVGMYYIVTNVIIPTFNKTNRPQESISDWTKLPKNFKEFSEKNSLKVELQSANQNAVIIGTAWSWYYKQTSDYSYDWYLMTNFHVVNETIAYINGYASTTIDKNGNPVVEITNPNELLDFYSKNSVINLPLNNVFNVKKFNFNSGSYQDLISFSKKKSFIESVDFVTDFNNNSLDLFSKSEETNHNNVIYNLDMALIKISLNFKYDLNYLNSKYNRANVYSNYMLDPEMYKKYKFNDAKEIYIAGNPGNQRRLEGTVVWPDFQYEDILLNIDDPILRWLKAPYYYSKDSYKNFLLSGGSSGSAVYQLYDIEDNDIDWTSKVPIGIYWGGKSLSNNEQFKPSIVPFIIDKQINKPLTQPYKLSINIFENFQKWLNNL